MHSQACLVVMSQRRKGHVLIYIVINVVSYVAVFELKLMNPVFQMAHSFLSQGAFSNVYKAYYKHSLLKGRRTIFARNETRIVIDDNDDDDAHPHRSPRGSQARHRNLLSATGTQRDRLFDAAQV